MKVIENKKRDLKIIAGDILQGNSSGNYYLVVIKSGFDDRFKLIDLTGNITYNNEHSGENLLNSVKDGTYTLVANTKSLTLDLSEGYVQ